MKNVYKQKREQGFTIIEVLIVLAIAALIFLIVFLAVPALNRSSRNNAIKHDAANLLSGVSTFSSNNNGILPGALSGSGTGTITLGPNSCPTGQTLQTSDVSIQPNTTVTIACGSAPAYPAGTGAIVLGMNYKCGTTPGANPVANQRSIVALFLVESGSSGTDKQCIES